MRSFLSAVVVGLTVIACTKTDRSAVVPEDPNWIRLEAPTGGEAMDVCPTDAPSVVYVSRHPLP